MKTRKRGLVENKIGHLRRRNLMVVTKSHAPKLEKEVIGDHGKDSTKE